MRTLSNDITLTFDTTQMTPGYVTTTIYHSGIGVFVGRSYVDSNHNPISINLNDFIIQNRNKYDYLQLKDDGEVDSMQLESTSELPTRWVRGQLAQYGASIEYASGVYTSQTTFVVTGYDYPNKDLFPNNIVYPFSPSLPEEDRNYLQRVMQGSDWFYNSSEDKAYYNNLLVPHYPAKDTSKYGFSLQLFDRTQYDFNLRTPYGDEFRLGYSDPLNPFAQTFVSLHDLLNVVSLDPDNDTPIYLKENGVSGDLFGDVEEGLEWYNGFVSLDSVVVKGYKSGVSTVIGDYDEGATFLVYVQKYMNARPTNWNIAKIGAGSRGVYTTGWNSRIRVTTLMRQYLDAYQESEVGKSSQSEMQYDYITVTPVFTTREEEREDPDKYIGYCTVGILDRCYSRYYLAWNDRYGDIMSQPFDGKIEYSENSEKSEMLDYKLKRRVIHNELQPKWKLNTKWINEDVYPMYESIFTSPYLLLYDTETDRSWNVILTNPDYKEKSYNNEKTLFNLEITVEANAKQNYIF